MGDRVAPVWGRVFAGHGVDHLSDGAALAMPARVGRRKETALPQEAPKHSARRNYGQQTVCFPGCAATPET